MVLFLLFELFVKQYSIALVMIVLGTGERLAAD